LQTVLSFITALGKPATVTCKPSRHLGRQNIMTETQSLAIDIINISPDNSICLINAPSINENSTIFKLFNSSDHNNQQLLLTPENKRKFVEVILSEGVEVFFHKLDIKMNNDFLFTAYDGLSGVEVSKKITVPDWFLKKYAGTLML
jgi:hypothetical protein